MRARIALALAGWFLAPAMALSQAEVTALSSDSEPLESTNDLRLSRFADLSEETTVAVGALLEIGDLLASVAETIDVELSCGAETVLRFSGGFRLLIEDPEETDCAVDLLSGTVDAQTDTPVEVGAGNVTLGVEGTQFSLSLERTEEGPERDLAVFEGKVRVRGDSIDQEVETGRNWRMVKGEQLWSDVSEAKAERSAALFARLDLAKGIRAGEKVEDVQKTLADLRALHLQVLTRPADKESRVELAKAQLKYKRDDAAAYHLKRADVTTEEELEANQIDKRIMPYLSREKVSAKVGGLTARPSPAPTQGTAVRAETDPFELIRQGKHQAAIEILEEQAKEEATSKVYFGLARAYAGLEGSRSETARAYAARALTLHGTDRKLSHEEQMWCRRTRGRPRS